MRTQEAVHAEDLVSFLVVSMTTAQRPDNYIDLAGLANSQESPKIPGFGIES